MELQRHCSSLLFLMDDEMHKLGNSGSLASGGRGTSTAKTFSEAFPWSALTVAPFNDSMNELPNAQMDDVTSAS